MKYADIKDDLAGGRTNHTHYAHLSPDLQARYLTLRVLHAIAGELDSISYSMRKGVDNTPQAISDMLDGFIRAFAPQKDGRKKRRRRK